MPVEVFYVLAGLFVAALVVLGVAHLRYADTPAAQWKRRVIHAMHEQQSRLNAARWRLAEKPKDESAKLKEEFLGHDLGGLAVEELARYPGIGPATVSRLRDAGLTTVADCSRIRLSGIQGIGPSRQAELKEAIRNARRDAESRFDAGASPGAMALAGEMKRREVDRQRQQVEAEQQMRAAEATLAAMEDQVRIARRITFIGYLRGRKPAGLTGELLQRPIVDAVVEAPPPAEVVAPMSATRPSAAVDATPMPLTAPPVFAAPRADPVKLVPPADDSPLGRLRVVAGFGLAVAKADGRIAASERKQVRVFLARRYASAPDLAGRLDALLTSVEGDLPTIGDALWGVRRVIPAESWPELYQFAVSVADAAGERKAREIECLARIAEELGVGPASAAAATNTPARAERAFPPGLAPPAALLAEQNTPLSEADCRATLEIAADMPLTVDLIRRQYRHLSDRYAPDKFGAHGPEFVQIATAKLDRVERAARQLLSAYNEPLEPPAAQPPADLRHNPLLDELFGG
jgi:uncharacterized tellurite resistance protein B-like protein